ncbi:energy-coupling factor ABC transporter ATP-binding protein [Hathewaya histolytica]|uniref:ABC transporter ATP-binding protein n=1 Tax=Hathewaya histolytica TaxID=1498 RepID=A0A4V6KDM3_HATHI|nr:energy-coupling factor ABC transporter ATP-binding protein [Hathewaya histolytica]VTQ84587.1 cobalt transporter ATP-binding subunit [Hathewaya histolytica]
MLKLENLCYTYEDDTIALKNVSIDLENGSIIGIIGANGAGKSTLFLNMVGILKPTSGNVYFNEEKLKYSKSFLYNFRKDVGLVFQDPDKQIFYSSVYDDVAFALRNLGMKEDIIKERVDTALKEAGAIEFKDKPVHFLSYGQKKRVAMAGILAMDCKVILFDEPTAGLDPEMTKSVKELIFSLSQKGKRIVITSHNMDLIYEVCDYVYVLNKGTVIGEGKVLDVFKRDELLKTANLDEPWLLKVHKYMNLPLFQEENELYEYWRKNYEDSSNRC